MHLNTAPPAPAAPAKKPCMRDMHELVTRHMPDQLIKLVPLDELERFGAELVAEQPRFAEEVPLRVAGEARRRARHRSLIGSRTPAPLTAQQAYSRA
ncbi:hypothetical protein [Hymenobacter negativus]|uniref:Uncharacterized protein n=1 Tax=Hymenobacter negativus TaxID=2795026 RepID=A0ABS3Q8X5_9BACT|nr:hypothetical protein [Hymenobacter negativus]MBO2007581.1 hypothetical protein [Hymenobacter negativus]